MPQMRQLAAIMFTDIAGYTALMSEDEQKALALLKKNRSIQRPAIERFNGRWLKEIGDGILASFPTATDAVYCAAAIQKTCEQEPDLKLRIGIHLGEVVFEENDVFGDGVNIASRLEPLAPIGGILVSGAVYKNIHNKKDIITEFVAEQQLRGVKELVRIYQVRVPGIKTQAIDQAESVKEPRIKKNTLWYAGITLILGLVGYFIFSGSWKRPAETKVDVLSEKSIAVLPLVDMSPDKDQDYLGDGIAEQLINTLAQTKDLKVIARTSSFQFKGQNVDIRELASQLGVDYVVEGSVLKFGEQLRITVQLIDARDGSHIWSNDYDRPFDNIFTMLDQIAQDVFNKISASLELVPINSSIGTDNSEAYENYLKGVHMHIKWVLDPESTEGGFNRAKELLQEAIRLDSSFADAYAGLADLFDSQLHISDPDSTFMRESKKYADIAYKLNPESCHSNHVQALVFVRRSSWKKAILHSVKAIEQCPGYILYYGELAYILHTLGFHQEAFRVREKALQRDPVSAGHWERYGWEKRHVGQFREAKIAFEEARDLDDLVEGLFWLACYNGDIKVVENYLADSTSGSLRFPRELYPPWLKALKGDTTAIQDWDKVKHKILPRPWPELSLQLLLAGANSNWTPSFVKSLPDYSNIPYKCCDIRLEFLNDPEIKADQQFLDLIQPLLNDPQYQTWLEEFEACQANNRVRFKEELDLVENLLAVTLE